MELLAILYLLTGYGVGVALVERWHRDGAESYPWRAVAVVFLFAAAWLPLLVLDCIHERRLAARGDE